MKLKLKDVKVQNRNEHLTIIFVRQPTIYHNVKALLPLRHLICMNFLRGISLKQETLCSLGHEAKFPCMLDLVSRR